MGDHPDSGPQVLVASRRADDGHIPLDATLEEQPCPGNVGLGGGHHQAVPASSGGEVSRGSRFGAGAVRPGPEADDLEGNLGLAQPVRLGEVWLTGEDQDGRNAFSNQAPPQREPVTAISRKHHHGVRRPYGIRTRTEEG